MRMSKREAADSADINATPQAPCGQMEGDKEMENDRSGTANEGNGGREIEGQ